MSSSHKEEHHIGPLSLVFPNWVENTYVLTKQQHALVHEFLDIPYGQIRAFKKRTNHLLFHNKYYVQQLSRLHSAYFARLFLLPENLQLIHLDCIKAVFTRSQVFYNVFIMYEEPVGDTKDKFNAYLSFYHSVLMAKAEAMEQKLI